MLDLSHNLLRKMFSLTYVMNSMPSYPERWKKRRWTRVELWNPCSFKHLPPGDNTSVGTWVELQECDQPKLGELAGMYPPPPNSDCTMIINQVSHYHNKNILTFNMHDFEELFSKFMYKNKYQYKTSQNSPVFSITTKFYIKKKHRHTCIYNKQ